MNLYPSNVLFQYMSHSLSAPPGWFVAFDLVTPPSPAPVAPIIWDKLPSRLQIPVFKWAKSDLALSLSHSCHKARPWCLWVHGVCHRRGRCGGASSLTLAIIAPSSLLGPLARRSLASSGPERACAQAPAHDTPREPTNPTLKEIIKTGAPGGMGQTQLQMAKNGTKPPFRASGAKFVPLCSAHHLAATSTQR